MGNWDVLEYASAGFAKLWAMVTFKSLFVVEYV